MGNCEISNNNLIWFNSLKDCHMKVSTKTRIEDLGKFLYFHIDYIL